MSNECSSLSTDFRILCHHIYEFRKGLRSLVLHTMSAEEREMVEAFLTRREIDFCIREVGAKKINVFFGNPDCVQIVRYFRSTVLNELSHEEDFMLGIMLGYDRMGQCARYLKRRGIPEPLPNKHKTEKELSGNLANSGK